MFPWPARSPTGSSAGLVQLTGRGGRLTCWPRARAVVRPFVQPSAVARGRDTGLSHLLRGTTTGDGHGRPSISPSGSVLCPLAGEEGRGVTIRHRLCLTDELRSEPFPSPDGPQIGHRPALAPTHFTTLPAQLPYPVTPNARSGSSIQVGTTRPQLAALVRWTRACPRQTSLQLLLLPSRVAVDARTGCPVPRAFTPSGSSLWPFTDLLWRFWSPTLHLVRHTKPRPSTVCPHLPLAAPPDSPFPSHPSVRLALALHCVLPDPVRPRRRSPDTGEAHVGAMRPWRLSLSLSLLSSGLATTSLGPAASAAFRSSCSLGSML